MLRTIVRQVVRIALTLFIGGLFAATLVRYAPGFESDEQQMDSRLSNESIQSLREARAGDRNILRFYAGFLISAVRGNLGISRTLNRPVRELVRERTPV